MGRFASVPLAAAVASAAEVRSHADRVPWLLKNLQSLSNLPGIAFCIIEVQRENLDDDALVAKFNIVSPFRSQAASEFNPREPRLSL